MLTEQNRACQVTYACSRRFRFLALLGMTQVHWRDGGHIPTLWIPAYAGMTVRDVVNGGPGWTCVDGYG